MVLPFEKAHQYFLDDIPPTTCVFQVDFTFAFIKVCPGLSWSRVNDLIRNSLIFGIFFIVMRWWACSHGRPKTFPIRIWYSLSIGELWVGLCSLLLHLNEFWVLLCLSYGPIISFFFKQYISEMSLLQTNIDKNCILHFDPLFSVQLLVEASTWKTNIELLLTSYQRPHAI